VGVEAASPVHLSCPSLREEGEKGEGRGGSPVDFKTGFCSAPTAPLSATKTFLVHPRRNQKPTQRIQLKK
jgi:hypothetical protein